MVLPRERLRAVPALEGRLAGVLSHVVDEVFSSRERLAAEVAAVRGLARVLADVVQQVLLASERLRTEVAAVRGFSCNGEGALVTIRRIYLSVLANIELKIQREQK